MCVCAIPSETTVELVTVGIRPCPDERAPLVYELVDQGDHPIRMIESQRVEVKLTKPL